MIVQFKEDMSFAFEFIRNLGFMYYGGSDLGEMIVTSDKIKAGDPESWFTEWDKVGRRILANADASLEAGHHESARSAYLRASTYFRMAEFYLHGNPSDHRILSEAKDSVKAYAAAARLTGATWEPVEIPYEGTTLPGYFYKVDDSGTPRPTLIFHGGYDSSLEELFYFAAAAAVKHGYNCLTWDGPGQGLPLREQKLTFRYDWEKVVTAAVDYALTRPDVDGDKMALKGMSLGGYLAARAVAFEQRFKAAIFYDAVYDFSECLKAMMPKEALTALEEGDLANCEQIVYKAMPGNTNLTWTVTNGIWTFGASGFGDLLEKAKAYTLKDGIAGKIRCPCLVMDAEGDMFFKGQPQQVYDELKAPKKLITFTAEFGAENHCQSGELSYKDEVVFNWLDETLGLHDGRKA